ncbi:MAG: hypothetical protein Kow0092_29460 [Deferrisomatales bacterium]
MDIREAADKLGARLPLGERQARLPPALRRLHRRILSAFRERGRPLSKAEVGREAGAGDPAAALRALAERDLVVLGGDGEVVGAYPFTTAPTPHRLSFGGHDVYAMCALDALGVAPLFETTVAIASSCAGTGEPIHLVQAGTEVVEARPSRQVHLGIRWQAGEGAAADTL